MTWTPTGDFLIEIVSASEEETFKIGQRIAASLISGSVVALEGTLGSGKTYLAKGIANGLGINETITSPTYTIISEYESMLCSFYHIDAYRLNSEEDFIGIGGMELINSDGICVVEWSERIKKSLPPDTITVTLSITGPSSRLIKINGIEI